jgi:hypothetical protein
VIAGFSLELAATKSFWRPGSFAFVALVNMIFTLAIDCNYGQSKAGVIIFTRLVVSCTTICLALIFSGLFFRRERNTWVGLVFNVLLFGLLDAFGDSIMGYLLVGLGVRKTAEILGSIQDGATYAPLFFVVTVYLVGVGFRQEKLQLQVASLINQLTYLQASGAELVNIEKERLAKQVQLLLGPKLAYAKSMIQDSSEVAELAGVLKFLNQSDLRPLAFQIAEDQQLLPDAAVSSSSIRVQPLSRFNVAKSLNPWLFLSLASMLLLFLVIFADQEFDLRDFAALVVAAIILAAIRLLVSKVSETKYLVVVFVQVAALILVSAGGLLTHWLFQYQESSLTFGFLVACLTSAFVISSMIALYIQRTAHLNASLLEVESELASVVSSIKQRRWVERSRVVTQLQGQVQGALVAAVTRLSDIADPDRIEKAKNDLDRASLAMYQIDQNPTDLVSAMEEMREAWLGICEIDLDLDQKAVKLCASNPTVTSVTAALITEGVVNAVRHGKATQVQVVIESAKGKTLRLVVLDNGKLKDKKSRGGGVALINELTTSWSLQRRDKKTVLEMFVSHLNNRNV